MTDLLLRKAQTVRAGAQGDEDYEIIGPDGNVIGRIFKPPDIGTGYREGRTATQGYEATRPAAMQAFARSWHRET
jgi:hypothetical protein